MNRCRRRRYRDELTAKIALAEIHRRDSPKRDTRESVPGMVPNLSGLAPSSEREGRVSGYRLTPLRRGLALGLLFSAALWPVMFLVVVSLVWFA